MQPLHRGMKGKDVAELQRRINAAGYTAPLSVDGDYGGNTEAAVKQYQAAAMLPVTGQADAATLRSLGITVSARPVLDAWPSIRSGGGGGPVHTVLKINSGYGPRTHPITKEKGKFHNGLDIGLPQGTPIYPILPGRIVAVYVDEDINGSGYTIDHGNGIRSSYVHLSKLIAKKGDHVDRSRPIGLSGGARGTWGAGRSTGPHLHLIVRHNGKTVDPVTAIDWRGHGVALTGKVTL